MHFLWNVCEQLNKTSSPPSSQSFMQMGHSELPLDLLLSYTITHWGMDSLLVAVFKEFGGGDQINPGVANPGGGNAGVEDLPAQGQILVELGEEQVDAVGAPLDLLQGAVADVRYFGREEVVPPRFVPLSGGVELLPSPLELGLG
eukprot:CAMPEP_0182521990 /NCGR_PEP_ID=MMETSP1321-20130603/46407_1 /TAXON_ID=91990 /ORGANISM="Bolidomonas sp., Strain RCC1657" /LENGTH=144 /DNA_ID=CAMNT_0024730029 /DNA_START=104 /DNA_END=537 /DNA_ORIENTATION=-